MGVFKTIFSIRPFSRRVPNIIQQVSWNKKHNVFFNFAKLYKCNSNTTTHSNLTLKMINIVYNVNPFSESWFLSHSLNAKILMWYDCLDKLLSLKYKKKL